MEVAVRPEGLERLYILLMLSNRIPRRQKKVQVIIAHVGGFPQSKSLNAENYEGDYGSSRQELKLHPGKTGT